jgi:predicted aspartyl protease
VKWYRLAAQQGKADAQLLLGEMYKNGHGVTQDYREAVKWYRLAAQQGSAGAQYSLGSLYEKGQGVAQDYREAVKWHRPAAQQGWAGAQYRLGILYEKGQGVAQDYREMVKWHRLAAQQGLAEAQFLLGSYYVEGQGVAQDYLLAYMWSSLAASKLKDVVMSEGATAARTIAEKKLTPAQVLRAQEMVKQCEESNYKQCDEPKGNQHSSSAISVPMARERGIYVVPVLINDAITLSFVVDSGAADVSIPADVVTTLMRTGTLTESDFLGEKTYVLGDGSKVPSQTFRIRSLKIGGKVVENVNGSIASVQGSLLLGQSFLSRFKSWSVDNTKHALVLDE